MIVPIKARLDKSDGQVNVIVYVKSQYEDSVTCGTNVDRQNIF